MRNEDRERAIVEITGRLVHSKMESSKQGGTPIIEVINDTIYHEQQRLRSDRKSPTYEEDKVFWRQVQRTLPRASEREIKQLLHQTVDHFIREIAGNFNPYVYQASVKLVPVGLGFLLNAVSPVRLLSQLPKLPSIQDHVMLSGKVEALRKLDRKGTIVFVPTHSSNMDSPVIGWSIFAMGLPPATYGAGLNLFTNPLLSFFMHNLGAYRVDRRKTAPLYKEILKEYATVSMEYGYNNLFFPGGTRSRSNALERKLKKGLMGTGLRAFINNLRANKPNPRIYFVPCTINYQLVLEAETLIDDFLKEAGKSRYIIEKDESSDIRKIYNFASSLATMDSQIRLVVGQALDPFGNIVDEDGESYDRRGRRIEIERYVMRNGDPVEDPQRDHEYTNELSESIAKEFIRDNMIMVTHLVAKAAFSLLRQKNPDMDLFRLLHTGGDIELLTQQELFQEVETLQMQLRDMEQRDELKLEPMLHEHNAEKLVQRALRLFKSYHTSAALQRRGDRYISEDMRLLYFYQNRLDGYALDSSSQARAA
ncbi:MAG: 1-acyl-sn-glycerol-3-phosphate acyltransferase [Myxococcales bacterium]|nr:1-acyl-sn-glycerol-3-phosphate acyltransferase [Myxococcales bacterium]MCB9643571.1 1-acyl-sn-glycerol-3-phosphate acyltransferase [Myxococcales bacterium]